MAQSVEFVYAPGKAGSLVLKIFSTASDTVVATSSSVTEGTNAKGRYTAVLPQSPSPVPAGVYQAQLLLSGNSVAWFQVTIGASGVYPIQDLLESLKGAVVSGITSLANWLRLLAQSSTPDSTALTELNSNGGTYDPTTASLQKISTSSGSSMLGPGGTACVVTLKDPNGTPIPQMAVWLTSDQSGLTTVAGTLYTDDNGNVTFMLVSGNTYYLWARKSGENPILGLPYTAS